MIAKGFIGLVRAAVGMTFFDSPDSLLLTIKRGTASKVVFDSRNGLLGVFGGARGIRLGGTAYNLRRYRFSRGKTHAL